MHIIGLTIPTLPLYDLSERCISYRIAEYQDILTLEAGCEVLTIGYDTLYDLLNSDKLKAFRNGRHGQTSKKSIKRYIGTVQISAEISRRICEDTPIPPTLFVSA